MKKKSLIHELRLGLDVIALADDPNTLLDIKADIIANQSIRFCEGLEIYIDGRTHWVFDIPFTQNSARNWIADHKLI